MRLLTTLSEPTPRPSLKVVLVATILLVPLLLVAKTSVERRGDSVRVGDQRYDVHVSEKDGLLVGLSSAGRPTVGIHVATGGDLIIATQREHGAVLYLGRQGVLYVFAYPAAELRAIIGFDSGQDVEAVAAFGDQKPLAACSPSAAACIAVGVLQAIPEATISDLVALKTVLDDELDGPSRDTILATLEEMTAKAQDR